MGENIHFPSILRGFNYKVCETHCNTLQTPILCLFDCINDASKSVNGAGRMTDDWMAHDAYRVWFGCEAGPPPRLNLSYSIASDTATPNGINRYRFTN